MKKNIFAILVLFLVSCQKEPLFPVEYDLIQGQWILDSYDVTDAITSATSVLPADALNHEMKITIKQDKILIYLENTVVNCIDNINNIEYNTEVYGSILYHTFYILYGSSKAILFSYTSDDDLLHLYYSVNTNTGVEPHYEFKFRRN